MSADPTVVVGDADSGSIMRYDTPMQWFTETKLNERWSFQFTQQNIPNDQSNIWGALLVCLASPATTLVSHCFFKKNAARDDALIKLMYHLYPETPTGTFEKKFVTAAMPSTIKPITIAPDVCTESIVMTLQVKLPLLSTERAAQIITDIQANGVYSKSTDTTTRKVVNRSDATITQHRDVTWTYYLDTTELELARALLDVLIAHSRTATASSDAKNK